ncbi:MAG: LacI family DNA-binding transcriptional regulator [Bacillota bacterium]|nr:LacI family DNA-binding transcriptional regulator [Bacillota bacterium]
MGKTITMGDIAKKLNVSTVTVSKALRDKEGVSEEIRTKIKEAANSMGYRYNGAAKSFKDGSTCNIGIIIAERYIESGTSYYWQLYKKVTDYLMHLDYFAVFEILKLDDEQKATIPKIIYEGKVDGIIILGQVNNDYYRLVKNLSVPIVFMDFYEKDTTQDFIVADNFYSMYLLTNYLIEMGHKDIGFIGNIKATSSIQDRFLGYIKALIENDIDINKCMKWYIKDRKDSGEYTSFELTDTLPTAFVCNCDDIGYELINKLERKNYNVPEDISIVGFDNINNLTDSGVGITTVEVDMKSMAQTAVDVLVKRINNVKIKYGIKQVTGKIVYKNSVKKI